MNFYELVLDAIAATLGASLFFWAKPLALALNDLAGQQHVRFPTFPVGSIRALCHPRELAHVLLKTPRSEERCLNKCFS